MKTLASQLLALANADLRVAKRRGSTYVCGTRRGALLLTMTADGGAKFRTFELLAPGGERLAFGSAKEVAPVIASLYSVKVAS